MKLFKSILVVSIIFGTMMNVNYSASEYPFDYNKELSQYNLILSGNLTAEQADIEGRALVGLAVIALIIKRKLV